MSERLPAVLLDTLRFGGEGESDLSARWRATDCSGLAELVAYEGAGIWLFRRLRATNALESLPPALAELLRQQAFEAAARRMEVEVEAAAVLALLNRAAVPVILIKGVARSALADRYPYWDARATSDVDLLVPADRGAEADAALRADGYVEAPTLKPADAPRGHHLAPLIKGRIGVELHDSTSSSISADVAWSRAFADSEVLEWGGQRVRVPPATDLAWNAIGHAMRDMMENPIRGFRLHRLLELAALVNGGAMIDWDVIRARALAGEAFDVGESVANPDAVVRLWIGMALALVTPEHCPEGFTVARRELETLLAGKLAIFRARERFGARFADRLLAEQARVLVELPLEPSPLGASAWGRVRRKLAGRTSRLLLKTWSARHRSPN